MPASHHRQLHSLINGYLANCLQYDQYYTSYNVKVFMDLRGKMTGYHPETDTHFETNPWNSYFDQPDPDDNEIFLAEYLTDGTVMSDGTRTLFEKYHAIHEKYLKIKSHILDKVDRFIAENFTDDIIAIHIRGTDSFYDKTRPHLSLNFYKDLIEEKFSHVSKIFLSTDSDMTRDTMIKLFPDRIVYYNSDLISFEDNWANTARICNSYKSGEDVLIESILMSRCKQLLRTKSNVTSYSIVLNPGISCHLCDLRFYQQGHLLMPLKQTDLSHWSEFYNSNLEPSTMAFHLEQSKKFEAKKFELWHANKIHLLNDEILTYYYGR